MLKWPQNKKPLLLLVIALCGILAFSRTLKVGFVWDDPQMIESNIYIRSWTLPNVVHHLTHDVFNQGLDYYRPLQSLSNALDFSIWKLNPSGYHLTNLLFHLLNACLLFLLAGELGLSTTVSLLSAVLFAVNPTVVEQLIVIAGRAEVMVFSFTLLSILAFLRKGLRGWTASLVFFVMAMLSKENGVITPFLIMLALFVKKEPVSRYLKLTPFLLLIAPYLYLRKMAVGFSVLKSYSLLQEAALALYELPKMIVFYIYNALTALNLHSHHMQPPFGADTSLYFLLLYSAAAVVFFSRNRLLIFSFLWYLLNLAPKIPILVSASNDYMLDHWVYESNFSLFLAIGFLTEKTISLGKHAKKTAIAFFCALTLFYAYQSDRNIILRGSNIKIYEHTLKHTVSYQAMYNLAREYYLLGEYHKALALIKPVVLREPAEIHLNGLALILARIGKLKDAAGIMDGLMNAQKSSRETFYNRAVIYEKSGDEKKAVETLERSLKLYPDHAQALDYIAQSHLKNNRKRAAGELFEKTLVYDPYDVQALISLGALKAENKEYQGAKTCWQKALAADPSNTAAKWNLKKLAALEAQ